jgi:hypothetical protein
MSSDSRGRYMRMPWAALKLGGSLLICAAIAVLTVASTQATVTPRAAEIGTATLVPIPNIADTPLPTPPATPAVPQDVFIPGRLLYVKGSVIYMIHHYDQPVQIAAGRQPSVSPDGKKLAYIQFYKNYQDLMLVDIQARAPRLLLDDKPIVPQDVRTGMTASTPAWSDNGKYVFFSWSYPGSPYYTGGKPSPLPAPLVQRTDASITRCAVSGPCGFGTARTLTSPQFESGGDSDAAPRLADPTELVYASWAYQQARDGVSRALASLQALNLVSGAVTSLTPPLDNVSQPVWSPNGRYLAFIKSADDLQSSSIWVMSFHAPGRLADYAHARLLVKGAPFAAHPVFSPDGKYLAFVRSAADGRLHLFVAPMIFGPGAHAGTPVEVQRSQVVDGDRLVWAPS